ncbi:MAG: protein kinase, partial [Marinicellaceae bacterium]
MSHIFMTDKNNSEQQRDIDNKIKHILDAIKDEDTLDLSEDVSDPSLIRDYSDLIDNDEDMTEFAIGAQISHWKIKKIIGKGGMSVVYLAERNDEQLNQQVALKVDSHGFANQSLAKRFIRERQILSDLNHQNIAKLYDVGVTKKGIPWFVMELIQGQNILEYAESNNLNIEQKIILFKQVCHALAYAHAKGIVHRDIKPGNLMVTDDKVVKLLDFGIASDSEQKSLTMTGSIIGTPGYMSPEQARGLNNEIDRRSDIFSAGVLLYKLIKGDLPFKAESISEISYKIIHNEPTLIGNQIPSDISAIVFKCLEKKVDQRYQSFKQLLDDLNAYLNGDIIQARKITFWGRSVKKIKKNPLVSLAIITALIASIGGITYGIYESFSSLKKVQLTKEYLSTTENIKNKIRRIHMMPLHNVLDEYALIKKEIESLKSTIESNNIKDNGMSDFALATAYQNMRLYDEALKYFKAAEKKGWKSPEMYTGLGEALAIEWDSQRSLAKSIKDDDEYKIALEKAKDQYYYPAIEYLQKAQQGSIFENYLKAKIALVDFDYEEAIKQALLDIEKNPWHYESLRLVSYSHYQIFFKQGSADGYDMAYPQLQKSNQALEKAIAIGSSDPSNYVTRCSYAGTEMQIQKYLAYKNIDEAYQQGLKYCKAAILLDPDAATPWANLSLFHVTYAAYLESVDQPSELYYKKSLAELSAGLEIFPGEYKLLIQTIKPLMKLVNFAIEKSEDPMPYFDRALDDAKKAAEINNKSHTPIFELARIYSNLS